MLYEGFLDNANPYKVFLNSVGYINLYDLNIKKKEEKDWVFRLSYLGKLLFMHFTLQGFSAPIFNTQNTVLSVDVFKK